jgi:hypothetical protein
MTHLHEDDPFRRFGRRTEAGKMASAHVPKILVRDFEKSASKRFRCGAVGDAAMHPPRRKNAASN